MLQQASVPLEETPHAFLANNVLHSKYNFKTTFVSLPLNIPSPSTDSSISSVQKVILSGLHSQRIFPVEDSKQITFSMDTPLKGRILTFFLHPVLCNTMKTHIIPRIDKTISSTFESFNYLASPQE